MFTDELLLRITISVLAVCGFLVAKHIHKHKKVEHGPLVCPVGFDCNFVVHSDYSEFMHVPLEIFGMIYYATLAVFYLYFIFDFIFMSDAMPMALSGFFILLSFTAFLFSIYLIFVQIFILKKGCSWCIVSALICLCIFVLIAFNYDFSFIAQIFIK